MNAIILNGAALLQPPLPQSGPRAKIIAHPWCSGMFHDRGEWRGRWWQLSQKTRWTVCIVTISLICTELVQITKTRISSGSCVASSGKSIIWSVPNSFALTTFYINVYEFLVDSRFIERSTDMINTWGELGRVRKEVRVICFVVHSQHLNRNSWENPWTLFNYENRQLAYLNLGLVHPVAPVFNENHKSITFVCNLSCLYCTQTTLSYNNNFRIFIHVIHLKMAV
jgi:hypothetical protein